MLADIYGTRWPDSYGKLPPYVWCQMFDKLADVQLNTAIGGCIKNHKKFPPSLPEFLVQAKAGPPAYPALEKLVEEYDPWHKGGQTTMLRFLLIRGGARDKDDLKRLTKEKNRIVDQYRVMGEDKDTDSEVVWDDFMATLEKRLEVTWNEYHPR